MKNVKIGGFYQGVDLSHMTRNHVTYKRFNWHKQSSTTLELQPHHTMRPLSVDKLNIVISRLHSGQTTCQISSSTGFSIGNISIIRSEHFSDLPKSSGSHYVRLSPANVHHAVRGTPQPQTSPRPPFFLNTPPCPPFTQSNPPRPRGGLYNAWMNVSLLCDHCIGFPSHLPLFVASPYWDDPFLAMQSLIASSLALGGSLVHSLWTPSTRYVVDTLSLLCS